MIALIQNAIPYHLSILCDTVHTTDELRFIIYLVQIKRCGNCFLSARFHYVVMKNRA